MDKKPWASKTVWSAVIVAATGFYPPAQEWIRANPEMYGSLLGGLFMVLRFVTGGSLTIKEK